MFRIVALIGAASLSAVAFAQSQPKQAPDILQVLRWSSIMDSDRIPLPVWRWRDEEPRTGGAANSRLAGSRSKGKIALGLGLIAGGLALMIGNPETSEYIPTSNGGLVRRSYRTRLVGGIIAGGGGVLLWSGLKRQR